MKAHRRGFTIGELAVSIAIMSAIAAAAGALYLEMRTAYARSDANVVLVREASLATETIARDLRNTKSASNNPSGIALDTGEGEPIRFVIDRSGLVRDDGDERIAIARFVQSVSTREVSGGFHLELTLERTLAEGRRVQIVRNAFIGARRK